jgi:hypothetical protein
MLTRRTFLQGLGAAGALLVAGSSGASALRLPTGLGPVDAYGTTRASRLFPGTLLAHADLHNHTLLSDGAGDPGEAFASMRDAGLDVAALTDHSTVGEYLPTSPCHGDSNCQSFVGIDESSWARIRALADEADDPGLFAAIGGFEWSSPTLGHVNVWFSADFTDPLHTVAVGMQGFYAWLGRDPSTPLLAGGADGLFGFNHPGREPGRFDEFAFDAALATRMVSLEMFNRRDDYLFEGVDAGRTSPLVACLDAGWRPGLLGVTDEHGSDWGFPDGKGRAGLWVDDLSRTGVRRALQQRAFFATNQRGLRLDAAANGTRMGGTLAHGRGPVEIAIDVDRGSTWAGKPLVAQVLRTASPLPQVVHVAEFTVPAADEVVRLTVGDVDVEDTPWLVLRVTDPEQPQEDPRSAGTAYAGSGPAIAYASPFYLRPA